MKSSERGSALVDFVLLTTPFILVPISVISISLITYTDAVLKDSAIEGARYAAMADQDSSAGCRRALQVAKKGVGGFLEVRAICRQIEIDSQYFERVWVSAQVPLAGLLNLNKEISGLGTAPREN
jgi:Flp pilus assembly protein TadG